jgi:hypothetical protein
MGYGPCSQQGKLWNTKLFLDRWRIMGNGGFFGNGMQVLLNFKEKICLNFFFMIFLMC